MIKKILGMVFLMMVSLTSFSQATDAQIEMATGLQQSGKIYVVVVVVSIIFIGIVGYLIMLDKRVCNLEKEFDKKYNS